MSRQPLRVGVIGLGAIGRDVVSRAREHPDQLTIAGAFSRSVPESLGDGSIPVADSFDDLLGIDLDIVVEVAGHEALREYAPRVLRSGRDLLAISVGALADPEVEHAVLAAASYGGAQLRVPSGAIGALDALAAARIGGIARVVHTTRKPASTLLGDEANGLSSEIEAFRGRAREAALRFPESVNVMAAVSLAGIGFDRTESVVIADPTVDRNIHLVTVDGEFGSFSFEIRNTPTDSNPKTGRIVAMSIISALRQQRLPIAVG